MPSINEVIERVNRARPDAIDDETKAAWLLELDGQLYRETILRHQLTSGRGAKGPVAVCPTCGGTEITYDRVMDSNLCPACGWTDLPDFPKAFPEDGDKPLPTTTTTPPWRTTQRWTNGGNSITAGTCPSAAGV